MVPMVNSDPAHREKSQDVLSNLGVNVAGLASFADGCAVDNMPRCTQRVR